MIERWLLALATALAAIAAINAWRSLTSGQRSKATLPILAITCLLQLMTLGVRGEMVGACPLSEPGEILVYTAWSAVLCYLIVGPTYRVSLLGLFTAPLVVILQLLALIPGLMSLNPPRVETTTGWGESHAALSVLAFGALALSAVSGSMYLILDHMLKNKKFSSDLFKNLPSISLLIESIKRLSLVGVIVLTGGIIAGFLAPNFDLNKHIWIAGFVWLAYTVFILWSHLRGMPPYFLAWISVILFCLSFAAFGII